MAITDQAAVKFSNEQFRVIADRLARCYYLGKQLSQHWAALAGTNDEKYAILRDEIVVVSNLAIRTFKLCWWADRIWQSGTLVSLFPNDAAEILFDNQSGSGPDTTRGEVTGQDLRRLKNCMEQFSNWMSRGTDAAKGWTTDALAVLPITYDYFDDVARLAEDNSKAPTSAHARIVAVDRCGDIVTRYETDSPSSLTHILKVAVRPGNDA